MSRDLPLVSVLTPVYNGAEYIEECMTSILRQTYPNWSYTIVDNCSTDETPEIVERIAHTDSRIRYVRFEEFVEANENHSRAAAAVEPESVYCKFVQADDWIYPECLERMVERAESADSIGIVGSYRLREDTVELVGLPYSRTVVPGTEVLRQCLLGGPYVTGSPTATLLRSEFVRRQTPFYDTGYWHADTDAAYRILTQSDFGFVHQVLTFSRVQQGTRSSHAGRVNTYTPENIRFLLRYGPIALSEAEYRAKLRLELRRYLVWHARQMLKPSRASDREFFDFHWTATERILCEGGEDPHIRWTMQLVRTLLSRDRVLNKVRPGHVNPSPSVEDSES